MQTVRAADTNEVVKLIFRESDNDRKVRAWHGGGDTQQPPRAGAAWGPPEPHGSAPTGLMARPRQVMLQLEKKLFDYFNQEVFREDNGTAVSSSAGRMAFSPALHLPWPWGRQDHASWCCRHFSAGPALLRPLSRGPLGPSPVGGRHRPGGSGPAGRSFAQSRGDHTRTWTRRPVAVRACVCVHMPVRGSDPSGGNRSPQRRRAVACAEAGPGPVAGVCLLCAGAVCVDSGHRTRVCCGCS